MNHELHNARNPRLENDQRDEGDDRGSGRAPASASVRVREAQDCDIALGYVGPDLPPNFELEGVVS